MLHPVIDRSLSLIGCTLLFGTMLITCVDVVGRYFLNAPLMGGFELTEVLMAALIFLGMPLVTAQDDHIKVDLLDAVVPARIRRFQEALTSLVCSGVSALITWTLLAKAKQVASFEDHTEVLHIPLAPVSYLMVVMMGAVTAIFFLLSVHRLCKSR
jgi:TRAP-type C4-dicarboxylate transport system permease small subunit